MADHGSISTGVEVEHEEEHIHLPGPSIWPFALSFFLFVAMIGLLIFPHYGSADVGIVRWVLTGVITAIGAIGVAWSIIAWGVQISEA
jgi:hypothetical protein